MLPVLLVGISAVFCRWSGRLAMSTLEVATRFSYALVPLGFSMWLAHYSFHFLTSFGAVIPRVQRFAGDLGCAHPRRAGMGARVLPAWSRTGFPGWRSCLSISDCFFRCIRVIGSL